MEERGPVLTSSFSGMSLKALAFIEMLVPSEKSRHLVYRRDQRVRLPKERCYGLWNKDENVLRSCCCKSDCAKPSLSIGLFDSKLTDLADLHAEMRIIQRLTVIGLPAHGRGGLAHDEEDAFTTTSDFDVALTFVSPRHPIRGRIGTPPFMECPTDFSELDPRKHLSWADHKPEVHHDLESLFYCLVWHALGYKRDRVPTGDLLRHWRKRDIGAMLEAKQAFIKDREEMDSILDIADPILLKEPVKMLWEKYNERFRRKKAKVILQENHREG